MSEPILAVENVSKRFAGRIALDCVSIDVAPGSITGMIGPNGSGKSTLFNIIAGTLRPDEGRVLVHGQNIRSATAAQICGLGVARTFQISRLFAEMTVLENLVAVRAAVTIGRQSRWRWNCCISSRSRTSPTAGAPSSPMVSASWSRSPAR
jgi:ABC-type branched-subunit amino acid transport system ATPase component